MGKGHVATVSINQCEQPTITTLDETAKQFFAEVGNALYNPNYFEQYAPPHQVAQTVTEMAWLGEYCATPGYVSENGPLELLPPIPTQEADTFDQIINANNAWVANCIASGLSVIHWDWVSIRYTTVIGGKNYSVFNPAAREISAVLRTVLEDWSLPDGSSEKDVIRVILEAILKVPVFGPTLDDDEEFMTLSASIGYLSRRSKGAEAVSMGDCLKWSSSFSILPYATLKSTHSADFIRNDTLMSRERVSVVDNGQFAEITMTVHFGGSGNKGIVKQGAERWSVCRTLPNGKKVKLKIIPADAIINEDVTVKTVSTSQLEEGETCTDSAQRGGTLIKQCEGYQIPVDRMIHIAEHEFGHILGFPNVYNEKTKKSFLGFQRDVMSVTTGLNQIYPYHLEVLLDEYK